MEYLLVEILIQAMFQSTNKNPTPIVNNNNALQIKPLS